MKVKGSVLAARKSFVDEHFGAGAWGRVLATLPEADREILSKGVTALNWYPFDMGQRLDQAIVQELGKGKPKVFEEIGAASARANLATVHKSFLTPGDPQAFLARAPVLYKFYYNKGHREYAPTGACSGTLTTYGAETFSALDCLTVVGWYKTALVFCGAKDVSITEKVCRAKSGPHCEYHLSWQI